MDLYWARKAIVEASGLFRYKYFPLNNNTEGDLVHRAWEFLEKCFDGSQMTVCRYVPFFILFIFYYTLENMSHFVFVIYDGV